MKWSKKIAQGRKLSALGTGGSDPALKGRPNGFDFATLFVMVFEKRVAVLSSIFSGARICVTNQ
jgi:hypothetical protein